MTYFQLGKNPNNYVHIIFSKYLNLNIGVKGLIGFILVFGKSQV